MEGWGWGGEGNEQVPFQPAEMKAKERIFMFTANTALNTKKRLRTQKRKQSFLKFPRRAGSEGRGKPSN